MQFVLSDSSFPYDPLNSSFLPKTLPCLRTSSSTSRILTFSKSKSITFPSLNVRLNVAGWVEDLGSNFVLMAMEEWAVGGR
jgi:hypothetical protein